MRRFLVTVLLLAAAGCGRAEIYQPGQAPTGAGGGAPNGVGGGEATGAGGGGEVAPLVLSDNGGCGDAFFFALNAQGTVMVTAYWPNRIHTNPPKSETTFPLASQPPDAPVVQLWRGTLLRDFACNDIIEPGAKEIHGSLISGKLKVEIFIGRESGAFGTMNLEDAVFADPAGGELKLTPLQVGPVSLGWLPG